MKLVFVGNSGSGKTTLAERVGLELGEAMNYTDLSSLSTSEGIKDFWEIIKRQEKIRDKILETIESGDGCFDRSLFDQFCYSQYFIGCSLGNLDYNEQHSNYFEKLKRAVSHFKWTRSLLLKREVRQVDFYVYCENLGDYIKRNNITFEYKTCKKRFGGDKIGLQFIYETMLNVLLPIERIIRVPATDLESRVDLVCRKVRGE